MPDTKNNNKEIIQSKKLKFQAPRGMKDILPNDFLYYDYIYENAKKVFEYFGFQRCEPPLLERAELYNKGVGVNTDIIEKEMYTLKTKEEGELLALRPEYTAGIIRSYLENGMFNWLQPVKLFSFGPVFRHEKPQAGRYRQFYQLNAEIIGDESPVLDVELILIVREFLKSLGFKDENLEFRINSIGCNKCRHNYIKDLKKYYEVNYKNICEDCKKRLKTNPLRVLDCKNNKCQNVKEKAPNILDYLCDDCKKHFTTVLDLLDYLEIPYVLDKTLVRGLDYYTKTVFEVISKSKEGDFAVAGGGRYDYLVKLLGGIDRPSVGVAFGVERLVEELKIIKKKIEFPQPKVFLIQLGDAAKKQAFKLLLKLKDNNISVAYNLEKDNIKSQLKNADRLKTPYALIIGQEEVINGMVILKDMTSGLQETIPFDKIINELKKRI
ncbi:MAG: histidine--tRNA ligase [Minisyncoccia bacterium]